VFHLVYTGNKRRRSELICVRRRRPAFTRGYGASRGYGGQVGKAGGNGKLESLRRTS